MNEKYLVRVEKERLVFCAAHFITYGDDVCEPLHGHNYRVAAEVEGPLEQNSYVVDFLLLRDALQALTAELDHRMLLPLDHPTIRVTPQEGPRGAEVLVEHGLRRWIFPAADCVLLPVANTTAELLARHLALRLSEHLPIVPARLRLEVDECDGQWGVYELCSALP